MARSSELSLLWLRIPTIPPKGFGIIAQPLRVAVTGRAIGPEIITTLFLLGRDRVIQRIQTALALRKDADP